MTGYVEGDGCRIDADATVGYRPDEDAEPTIIGDGARVRAGTVIYADVEIGRRFSTGHNALVRGGTKIGDDVTIGTNAVVDGQATIGSNVSAQTGVYIPPETSVRSDVFLGPHAVLTNDRYPLRTDVPLAGPTVERGASVGANATLLPDVTVGENAFVAAGALVADDVPPDTLAVGTPARHEPLPAPLVGGNAPE